LSSTSTSSRPESSALTPSTFGFPSLMSTASATGRAYVSRANGFTLRLGFPSAFQETCAGAVALATGDDDAAAFLRAAARRWAHTGMPDRPAPDRLECPASRSYVRRGLPSGIGPAVEPQLREAPVTDGLAQCVARHARVLRCMDTVHDGA